MTLAHLGKRDYFTVKSLAGVKRPLPMVFSWKTTPPRATIRGMKMTNTTKILQVIANTALVLAVSLVPTVALGLLVTAA